MQRQSKNILPRDGEVIYRPGFFPDGLAEDYFERLLTETPWREEAIRIFGKSVLQPRRTAWYGDYDYSYSGTVMPKSPFTPLLLEMKSRIEEAALSPFNGVLLNHYRHGKDSMGWHRDNEKELGEEPVIASISLGEPRRFLLRHRQVAGLKVEQVLEHGSLLIMRGKSQEAWEHALPKSQRVLGPRINLTFRLLLRD